MGKLVLGILFVILLQVVFFGYTSRYWSTPKELDLVKARPNPSESHPALVPPTVIPPATDIIETPSSAETKKIETLPRVRGQARSRVASSYRVRNEVRRDYKEPSISNPVSRSTRPKSEQLISASPLRNTVILYNKPAPASERLTADISSKPKKRSLFAKSFSVVVKKPWGWMKSLASKLN